MLDNSRKITLVDDHIVCVFDGLEADARVLLRKAQVECQSHRLTYEDPIAVQRLGKYIATYHFKYTQHGGVRPFGAGVFTCGFDHNKEPHIYESLPSGSFSEWKAKAMGQFDDAMLEYFEKSYDENMSTPDAVRLIAKAMKDVGENRVSNMEIVVFEYGMPLRFLTQQEIQDALV